MPEIDIQEGLTRKLGPLPTWGWGIAIAGAVLVYRVVRGGSNAGGTVVGGGGSVASDNLGAGDTGSDDFQGSSSLVSQLMANVKAAQDALDAAQATDVQQAGILEGLETRLDAAQAALAKATATNTAQTGLITGLTGRVGTLSSINTLQTRLLTALNQRASLLSRESTLRLKRNGLNDQLRACTTSACRTARTRDIRSVETELATNSKTLTTLNATIAAIQKQIGAING